MFVVKEYISPFTFVDSSFLIFVDSNPNALSDVVNVSLVDKSGSFVFNAEYIVWSLVDRGCIEIFVDISGKNESFVDKPVNADSLALSVEVTIGVTVFGPKFVLGWKGSKDMFETVETVSLLPTLKLFVDVCKVEL